MTAIVFCDTETTGLALDDDIWEFAAIRREPDGTEAEHHFFIEHDTGKCNQLPESFHTDHVARYNPDIAYSRRDAAKVIAGIFYDRPHVVGAVPNFDTERIALLLRRFGLEPGWHYHLIDVENLAVGYLRAVARWAPLPAGVAKKLRDAGTPPWDSDTLSLACDVAPPGEGVRHTAMGDVRWAMALYDRIMAGYNRARCLDCGLLLPDLPARCWHTGRSHGSIRGLA